MNWMNIEHRVARFPFKTISSSSQTQKKIQHESMCNLGQKLEIRNVNYNDEWITEFTQI